MDFSLDEQQTLILDTAADFLAERSPGAAVRAVMDSELGYDEALWRRCVEEMAWQGMHMPVDCGGLGLSFVELAIVLEQMGETLFCSPFFSTTCLAGNALLVAASPEQRRDYLAPLAAGTATAALVGLERPERIAATRDGSGWILNGDAIDAVNGHSADCLVLVTDAGMFVADADAEGISRRWTPSLDQTRRLATLRCDGVALPDAQRLARDDAADAVWSLAAIALAAEQVGGARWCLRNTVDYVAERRQFNRAIGSFQAVKHQCADMMLKVETACSAARYSACVAADFLAGGPLAGDLPAAAALAKSYCSDAFFDCAATALQLHGGMGFTWECDVHLYFKRARAAAAMLGPARWHRERLAARLLDAG